MNELSYKNNPKSLFRKYAKLVTWFSNTSIGKEYLDLSLDEKIGLFLPNGYHKKIGNNKYEATFYSRALYAPKLLPALRVVDFFNKIGAYSDIKQIQKALLYEVDNFRLFNNPFGYKHKDLRLRFLTLTKNPDANPESTTVDGLVARTGVQEAWATIIAAAGTIADDSSADMYCQATSGSGTPNWNNIYRIFTLFDTSSLTTSAIISAAVYSLYLLGQGNALEYDLRLVTTTPASNTALATGDFGSQGTVAQATDLTPPLTLNAYNDWTLNATGLGNISKTGITKFGLRLAKDADAAAPTWPGAGLVSDSRQYQAGDSASNKPKLVITYTLPATGGYIFIQA